MRGVVIISSDSSFLSPSELLGPSVLFPECLHHFLLQLVGVGHNPLHLVAFIAVLVDDGVVVLAVEFDKVWEVRPEVDEEGCSQVLDVVSHELQPLDALLVIDAEEFVNIHDAIAADVEFLQFLELFDALERPHAAVSEGEHFDLLVLGVEDINVKFFVRVAQGDLLDVRVEMRAAILQVVRKHNEFIILTWIYLRPTHIFCNELAIFGIDLMDVCTYGLPELLQQSMIKDRFLSLCDPHNSIIHQFGCEGSCTRSAGICLRGCNRYQHQQKANRHQFLDAKEFYSIVGSIRERYDSFKGNFREVYLRKYMDEVVACVNSFEEYILGEFLEKNPMIDIFCKYSSCGEAFQQLIEEKIDEVEFAEVRCKDVFQLKLFEQSLQREGLEEQERRMMKLLSKIFQHHLRNNKILVTQKQTQQRRIRSQDMLQSDRFEALANALQRKTTNLEYAQRQEKVEELLLILRCDLKDYENSQTTDSLGKLFSSLQNYMEKTIPQRLVLAVNFPITLNPFWQKFTSFIGNKGLKQVSVLTTASMHPKGQMEGQIIKRYEGSLPVTVKHDVRWEEVSDLIDKKPDKFG